MPEDLHMHDTTRNRIILLGIVVGLLIIMSSEMRYFFENRTIARAAYSALLFERAISNNNSYIPKETKAKALSDAHESITF
jgi:hypothetical protein